MDIAENNISGIRDEIENVEKASDDFDDGIGSTTSSIDGESRSPTAKDDSKDEASVEWEDILGSKELFRKVIKAGTGDVQPTSDSLVTIRVEGKLDNGQIVDCCDKLCFLVGHSEVITAFDICVPFMKVGEIDSIRAFPRFAYGSVGKDNEIPPNATVTYTVELLCIEKGPDIYNMTIEERLRLAEKKKQRGNYYFQRGEYQHAIDVYYRALKIVQSELSENENDGDRKSLLDASATLYNNLAAAQLKIEAWDAAIESLRQCSLAQPNNVKALFRKAQAHIGKGEYDTGIEVLQAALVSDPNNQNTSQWVAIMIEHFAGVLKLLVVTSIRKELARVSRLRSAENKEASILYKRMFREVLQKDTKQQAGIAAGISEFLKDKRWVIAAVTTAIAAPLIYRFIDSKFGRG